MLDKGIHKPSVFDKAANGVIRKSPAASRSPYSEESLNKLEKFGKYGPSNFVPRAGQKSVLDAYWEGCRKFSLCGHRRWGKDTISWVLMIISAIIDPGHYYYVMARKDSAKALIIDGLDAKGTRRIDYLPKEVVQSINEKDGVIHFKNGSIIYFISEKGAEARLVGQGPKGIVFSDYSLHKQKNLYGYIAVALKESGGWVLFNFTPRGEKNYRHAWDQHKRFELLDDWFTLTLSIIDTGLVTEEEINEIRKTGELEEYQIQTEFYLRLAVDTSGSYYKRETERVKATGRLRDLPYDVNRLVHTAWDLGKSDLTSIMFFQIINNFMHVLDLFEDNEQTIDYYISHLRNMKYANNYGGHFVPHDANKGSIVTKKTVMDIGNTHKFNMTLVPRTSSIEADVIKIKQRFEFIKFDYMGADQLFTNIEQYKRQRLTQSDGYSDKPAKSVVNHSVDAFRTGVIAWRQGLVDNEEKRIMNERYDSIYGNTESGSMGSMGGNGLDRTFRNL